MAKRKQKEKIGSPRKLGGDGITIWELDGGKWQVRWWEEGKSVRRRVGSKDDALKMADAERKKRETLSKTRAKEDKLVKQAAERGDYIVSLLNMDVEDRQALMLAAAKMSAAGASAKDLVEAAEEWIEGHVSEGSIPLAEAVAQHVEAVKGAGRAPTTVTERRWRLGGMVASIGATRPVAGIRRGEVTAWVEGEKAGSRPHCFRAASAFFRWAWMRGLVQRNPLEGVAVPKGKSPSPRIMSPKEVRALLAAAAEVAPGMLGYFAVGVFAGLRPSRELAGLDWSEVDLGERAFFIPWGRVKTGRSRRVPMSENLAEFLSRTPKGERHGLVAGFDRDDFRAVVEKSGVSWQEDLMRHTRVSYRLAETGGNVAMVALEGGHAPAILARNYAEMRIKKADVEAFWKIRIPIPTRQRPCRRG